MIARLQRSREWLARTWAVGPGYYIARLRRYSPIEMFRWDAANRRRRTTLVEPSLTVGLLRRAYPA